MLRYSNRDGIGFEYRLDYRPSSTYNYRERVASMSPRVVKSSLNHQMDWHRLDVVRILYLDDLEDIVNIVVVVVNTVTNIVIIAGIIISIVVVVIIVV